MVIFSQPLGYQVQFLKGLPECGCLIYALHLAGLQTNFGSPSHRVRTSDFESSPIPGRSEASPPQYLAAALEVVLKVNLQRASFGFAKINGLSWALTNQYSNFSASWWFERNLFCKADIPVFESSICTSKSDGRSDLCCSSDRWPMCLPLISPSRWDSFDFDCQLRFQGLQLARKAWFPKSNKQTLWRAFALKVRQNFFKPSSSGLLGHFTRILVEQEEGGLLLAELPSQRHWYSASSNAPDIFGRRPRS